MNVPPAMGSEERNQAPNGAAASRAWDLLRSMKEQRESLVERWKESGGGSSRPTVQSNTGKDTRSTMKELRRNLEEGQRRRMARRVSIDGSDRTPSTAASTTDASSQSAPAEHIQKSIHMPNTSSVDSPVIDRVASQESSTSLGEESSSKVSSESSSLPTRTKDHPLQVPTLRRRTVETHSKTKNARPPTLRKKDLSIPRHIVSVRETHVPLSPLSVSPLSVRVEMDSPSKPIVEEEEVECSPLNPKGLLEESSSQEDMSSEVPPKSLLHTKEERSALHMGQLYASKGPRTPPKRPGTGLRRPERPVVRDAVLHPPKEEVVPSEDDSAAIVNMSFLQQVVELSNKLHPPKTARPPSPLSSSWSDASSTTTQDFTTSSDTSGWVSTGESTALGGLSCTTERSMSVASVKRKPRINHKGSSLRTISCTTPVTRPRRPLFVTARTADALCRANGGHWSMAQQSGWNEMLDLATWTPRDCAVPTRIRLSTDFRCGTYGSLYNIAMRSGMNSSSAPTAITVGETTPGEPKTTSGLPRGASARILLKSKGRTTVAAAAASSSTKEPLPFLPARGGIYDTAVYSGFSAEPQRSSFSITTHYTSTREAMVPEHISDGHCGVVSVFSAASLHVIPE